MKMKYFLWILGMIITLSCQSNKQNKFITVEDGQFKKNGEPYYFIGTNYWYGQAA